MEQRPYFGPVKKYSEEFRQDVLRRIEAGEFYSIYHAAKVLGVGRSQIYNWAKRKNTSKDSNLNPSKVSEPVMKENKKEIQFVEPVPTSFKNEEEKSNYFMMRSYYLEELFKLSDLDEDVKKKALLQLEQRVRERIARGDKSPY